MLSRQEKSTKQLVEVLGLVQSTSGLPTDCSKPSAVVGNRMLFCHSEEKFTRSALRVDYVVRFCVDKELFTSFLTPKNVFPVAVLLELVLRSVLNHQGIPISLILQILAKKHTIFPIRYEVSWMHSFTVTSYRIQGNSVLYC